LVNKVSFRNASVEEKWMENGIWEEKEKRESKWKTMTQDRPFMPDFQKEMSLATVASGNNLILII